MAIENTSAPSPARGPARTDAVRSGGHAAARAGAAPAAGGGGFSAVLGALGAAEEPATDAALAPGLLAGAETDGSATPRKGRGNAGLAAGADLSAADLAAAGLLVATVAVPAVGVAASAVGAAVAVAGAALQSATGSDDAGTAAASSAQDAGGAGLAASVPASAVDTAEALRRALAPVAGTAGRATATDAASNLLAASAAPATPVGDASALAGRAGADAAVPAALPNADTLRAAGGVPGAEAGRSDGVAGYRTIFSRMQQALAHAPAGGRAAAAVSSTATAAGSAADAAAGAVSATVALASNAAAPATASTVSLGEGGGGHARFAAVLEELPRAALLSDRTGGDAAGSGRQERGMPDGNPSGDAAAAAAVGFGAPAPAEGATPVAGASTVPDPGTADAGVQTAEEQLADQIGRWVGQKTHSASMTLDAFGSGGAPVDVRIALSGSEAHVTFSSDQADTRALLGSAVDELRNLLQNEGLVLSGMSVGGGGGGAQPRGDAQTSARDGRSDRAPATVGGIGALDTGGAAPAQAPRRPTATSGRALDLFV